MQARIRRRSLPTLTALALCLAGVALVIGVLTAAPRAAAASKVVGNGTAASCSEAALRAALDGGGRITFSCGGAVTIPISSLIEVAAATEIDGGGNVTLDAGGAARIFYVNKWEYRNGLTFELRNLTLTGGRSGGDLDPDYGGCVYARRSVIRLVNVTLRSCEASREGGGLYVYGGEAGIEGGLYTGNRAMYGGAISTGVGAKLSVSGATFSTNRALGDGGAIHMEASALDVLSATFSGNVAEGSTGLPYAGLGGAIYTNNVGGNLTVATSTFEGNRAAEGGGAIFADYYTSSSIVGSTFRDNVSLPPGAESGGHGGAIGTARSTLLLVESQLRGNRAREGGAIYNGSGSTMVLGRLNVAANSAVLSGGGIHNIDGRLTLADSTVADNTVGAAGGGDSQGGGLVSYGASAVTVQRSLLSHNQALGTVGLGGGLFVDTTDLSVELSTITGNSALDGGGMWHNSGESRIVASTLAGNTAVRNGANIAVNRGAPELSNTLVFGAAGGASCSGAVVDGGNNLQFPGAGCGATIRVADPLLGALADNGGLTATVNLTAGSPAIDGGNPGSCPAVDQRGFSRVGTCDIGAFEFGSTGPPDRPYRIALPLVVR